MEKFDNCAEALRRHGFEVLVVENTTDALAAMTAIVEAQHPALVSFGDSMTMRATGIVEWLREHAREEGGLPGGKDNKDGGGEELLGGTDDGGAGILGGKDNKDGGGEELPGGRGWRLLDGFDAAMPRPERLEIRRQALMSDLFVTGVNAITVEGTLHWLDMVGNRIAPVAFGPRKVVLVAGRNKIVAGRIEAEERIRSIAAPRNIARHAGWHTPCAVTGVCSDCNSPDRICNTRMEMLRCHPAERIAIILINQDLGL